MILVMDKRLGIEIAQREIGLLLTVVGRPEGRRLALASIEMTVLLLLLLLLMLCRLSILQEMARTNIGITESSKIAKILNKARRYLGVQARYIVAIVKRPKPGIVNGK